MKTALYVFITLSITVLGKGELESCGQLTEEQVYKETSIAALNEFPWFGRIYFTRLYYSDIHFHCVGVLVSKRHLLAPAHCFWHTWQLQPISVLLGDANYGNADNETDCDASGQCAPVPISYKILDIAISPNFHIRQRHNDLAVVQLWEEVVLSPYIQPICLPPPSVYAADFLAQYLQYAGFLKEGQGESRYQKTKTVAHVKRRERCVAGIIVGDSYMCASSPIGFTYTSGSALMGVNIEDGELRSYYLIGLLSQGTAENETQLELFTKISTHINWIRSNINIRRGVLGEFEGLSNK